MFSDAENGYKGRSVPLIDSQHQTILYSWQRSSQPSFQHNVELDQMAQETMNMLKARAMEEMTTQYTADIAMGVPEDTPENDLVEDIAMEDQASEDHIIWVKRFFYETQQLEQVKTSKDNTLLI